jgi:hypothetical protein
MALFEPTCPKGCDLLASCALLYLPVCWESS